MKKKLIKYSYNYFAIPFGEEDRNEFCEDGSVVMEYIDPDTQKTVYYDMTPCEVEFNG